MSDLIFFQKREPFICRVCTKPGMGPRGTVVHPGTCREKRTQEILKRSVERRKRKRERALAAAS